MTFLLFIFYCILFCWLITRLQFFKNSGLPIRIVLILFLFRILSLIFGCYINLYILPVSDPVTFHQMGIEEFNLLFQNPHEYLVNILQKGYPSGYGRLLEDTHSFWNNLRTNLLVKMLSLFDLLSLKSFLINTLFYNFLIFFGSVALYKVFIQIFPRCVYPLIFCIFLLPSALFFSAMIHRDGLILLSVSMIVYHLFYILHQSAFSWKRILLLTLFLLFIFLLRNFVFITLIPALIGWLIANKFPKHAFISFLAVYVFTAILFFSMHFIIPAVDLPNYVSLRQQSFIELGKAGTSTIPIHTLQPTFSSFLINSPQAFNHVLMRPYLWEIASFQYVPFAIEIFLLEVLLLLFLFFRKKIIKVHPVVYFGIFFSLSILLVIGYTVPIIGAIVRYRSIYLIFLVIPLCCYTNWEKVTTAFFPRLLKKNTR